MKKFNERLSYLMTDELRLSGYALGTELGHNVSSVIKYKNGQTVPSITFIEKFCRHYGISANWLILEIGPIRIADLASYEQGNVSSESGSINKSEFSYELDKFQNMVMDIKEKYGL